MKKVTLILFAFLLFSGLTVEAQSNMNQGTMRNMHNQSGMMQGYRMGNYGMMSGGMMGQGMMNGSYGYMMQGTMPMWLYERMVTMLPQMQAELSLTSDQTNKLIDLQSAYQKKKLI